MYCIDVAFAPPVAYFDVLTPPVLQGARQAILETVKGATEPLSLPPPHPHLPNPLHGSELEAPGYLTSPGLVTALTTCSSADTGYLVIVQTATYNTITTASAQQNVTDSQ